MGLFLANPQPSNEQNLSLHCGRPRLQIGQRSQVSTEIDTGNLHQRTLGGVATVFHSATPPIHSRSAQRTSRKTGVCRMHAPLESPAATASDTSPEMPRTAATASNHRKRQLKQRPSHPTSRLAQWPVSPFVAAFLCRCNAHSRATVSGPHHEITLTELQEVPGTTRNTPTGRDCLAADTAQVVA
jgi:hypothetical protein